MSNISSNQYKRFTEMDVARAICVLLMIFDHLVFDLKYFLNFQFILNDIEWSYLSQTIGALFLIISGISLKLKQYNYENIPHLVLFRNYLKRGVVIFIFGMLITLTVKLFTQEKVYFGILHLIGFSTIVTFFFLRYPKVSLILSLCAFLLSMILDTLPFENNNLLFLHSSFTDKSMLDYYPILPWIGFVFFGIFLGSIYISQSVINQKLKKYNNLIIIKTLSFIGRKSLVIYLIHQPILIFLILLFSRLQNIFS